MDYSEIRKLVSFIYGKENSNSISESIIKMLEKASGRIEEPEWYDCNPENGTGILPLDEKDSVLITYGDQFRFREESTGCLPPLAALDRFIDKYIGGSVSSVHILPFSPYSSDDGFSVIDYRAVNPEWGSWEDIERIGKKHRLMADLVLNHCSAESEWFKKFLQWDSIYKDYFITVEPGTDVSMVFRPRALPLLTPFATADGEKLVWTTFSSDQVDLNYANPDVLIEMLSIFMFYVQKGVSIIRLDAIAFLWKEEGHSCLHHEKTHAVVKLFREAARLFAPWVVIITETNVPHEENLSYFGNGKDEAHMVYQFALPPLTLDAFLREDASFLRKWASTSLGRPSDNVSFFNFLASHDGIGVLPAKGILGEKEIGAMLEAVTEKGGLVSYKAVKGGNIPYEMNINYRSAVSGGEKDREKAIDKFMASQAIMLSMQGVPGIYIHSMIGSLNYKEGVSITGMNRTINREKFIIEDIESEFGRSSSERKIILERYKKLLEARKREKAFHPASGQQVLPSDGALFAFTRTPPGEGGGVLCLFNISGAVLKSFPGWDISGSGKNNTEKTQEKIRESTPDNGREKEWEKGREKTRFVDIITGKESYAVVLSGSSPMVTLEPWQYVWLRI